MANEIYNTSWWGNALDTARTAGTDPDFFGSQMKLLTSEQDNLITNGTFDTDSGWDKAGNVTIQNGIAAFVDNGTNANSYIQQSVLTTNKNYNVIIEVTRYVAGRIQIIAGSNTYDLNISAGTGIYKLYVESGSGTIFRIKRYGAYPNFDFDIDNVSVQLVRCDYDELGDELVTNGSFDTDSDWIKGGGATISSGKANIVGDGSTYVYIQQNAVFTTGVTYRVSADVTINSGLGLKFQDGATNENIGFATSSGTYVFEFTAGSNTSLVISRRTAGTAFDSSVDNVSVKEVMDHVEAKKCLADWIHRFALEDLKY